MNKINIKENFAILSAILAAAGYGSWAIFSNYEYEIHVWIMAGIVQGIYAFISTLTITNVARWVFFKYKCEAKGIISGFLASFFVMIAIPVTVHGLVGTPNIIQTILPGLVWGSTYLIVFLVCLDKKVRKNHTKCSH